MGVGLSDMIDQRVFEVEDVANVDATEKTIWSSKIKFFNSNIL